MSEEHANMMIANSNEGITNVVESKVMNNRLSAVFEKIFNILKDHYGPYSKFAMIADPVNPLNEPIHTKDGINILSAVNFISPMEDIIKRAVAHIGRKVESSAGDGTTSAMMLMCSTLKHMIKHLSEADGLNPVSYEELRNVYDVIGTHLVKYLSDTKITLDILTDVYEGDRKSAIHDIAFWQSYSSSHGDEKLAEAIAHIFTESPEETWDHLIFNKNDVETENRIDVEQTRGQFDMHRVRVMNKKCFNQDAGFWYRSEPGTKIYILNDQLRADSPKQQALWEMLRNKESGKIAIIAVGGTDDATFSELTTITQEEYNRVAIFTLMPNVLVNEINDLHAIMLAAGLDIRECQFSGALLPEDAFIEYEKDTIYLDNVFHVGEGHINQNYLDDNPYTVSMVNKLRNDITRLLARPIQDKTTVEQLNEYRRLLNRVYIGKQMIITIGGLSYDNIAYYDVVMDALSAVRTTFKYGFVSGNNKCLRSFFFDSATWLEAHGENNKDISDRNKRIMMIVCNSFRDALDEIAKVALSTSPNPTIREMDVSNYQTVNMDLLKPESSTPLADLRQTLRVHHKTSTTIKNLIIQPVNVDRVVFERFGEVALKYVMTARIIIKNAAYLPKGDAE